MPKPTRRSRWTSTLAVLTVLLVFPACARDDEPDEPDEPDQPAVPEELASLPFLADDFSERRGGAQPGNFREIQREKLAPRDTEGIEIPTVPEDLPDEVEELEREKVPELAPGAGEVEFEFYHAGSGRYFLYTVDRGELAKASRYVSRDPQERVPQGEPVNEDDMKREEEIRKSWSNATDNRIRRGIADGWSDTNSIYQRIADYGGCSANVLYASNTRMVAQTAAHCVFVGGGAISNARIRPRRDNGNTSPTWGSWSVYGWGYYPAFLNNDCDDNWDGGDCIKHDIALVLATPNSGASPPQNMGWGYRPKSFLDSHVKYRRGYPGCGFGHSPSPCTANTLYGDGSLSVGNFSQTDSDGWNRRIRFSSDLNPGDSGSNLYYYRNGFPYTFAVTSAEQTCFATCTGSRPNYARRITPQWFDFINSVVP